MLHLKTLDPAVIEHPRFQALHQTLEERRGDLLGIAQEGYWLLLTALNGLSYGSVLFLLPWWIAALMAIPLSFLLLSLRGETSWAWQILDHQSREGRRANYYKHALLSPSWLQHRWVLGLHQLFFHRWKTVIEKGLHLRLRQSRLRTRSYVFADVMTSVGLFGGSAVLLREALTTGSVGALVVFLPAFQALAERITNVLAGVSWIQRQLIVPHLFSLIQHIPAREEGTRSLPKTPLTITFEGVSFAYPDTTQTIIHGLDITFREGEYVALVGLNGAGKSTFLKLLAGIYRPTAGRILVNGIPLERIRSDAWVKYLGYMNQDIPKFDDTIENIIGYGRPGAVWGKEAKAAARVSGFDEVLKELPKREKTHVGRAFALPEDEPVELSGGQQQLLMIAQTLHRPARVMILDEPTSAVDAEKEDAFFRRLPEAVEGRLCLVVSHRFSVLRRAERILVMDGGKIIEDGSHDSLVEKKGRYAELFALQAKMYQ